MQTAVQSFLRFLRIERNASEQTVKSYSDDFESFREYCLDRLGYEPEPQHVTIEMLRGLRGVSARLRIRTDDDRPTAGLSAELLSLHMPGGDHRDQPGEGFADAARRPQAAALSDNRTGRDIVGSSARQLTDGSAGPGHSGDAVLRRFARGGAGGTQRV